MNAAQELYAIIIVLLKVVTVGLLRYVASLGSSAIAIFNCQSAK